MGSESQEITSVFDITTPFTLIKSSSYDPSTSSDSNLISSNSTTYEMYYLEGSD